MYIMEDENEMYVKKRNGNTELLSFDKISKRLKSVFFFSYPDQRFFFFPKPPALGSRLIKDS